MNIQNTMLVFSLIYAVTGYGTEQPPPATEGQAPYPPSGQAPASAEESMENSQFIHKTPVPEEPAPAKAGKPVSLDDIISNTVAYPAVLSAEADVNASQGDKRAADMQRYPSLSVSSSTSGTAIISPILQIQQPLWTGGRITGQIEEAEHMVESAQAKKQTTTYTVALKAVSAWQNLIDTQNSIKINGEILANLEDYRQFMERRVASGVSPQIELQLVLTRIQQVLADIQSAKAINQVAKIQIRQLTGDGYTDPELESTPTLESQVILAKQWIKNRLSGDTGHFLADTASEYPAVVQAQKDVEVLRARHKIREAAYYPTVSVGYQYIVNGGNSNFNNSNDGRFTLGLTYQPGAGLSSYESAKAAEIRAEGARNAIETAKLDILESINTDIQDALSNQQREDMLSTSVEASNLVLESYKRQFVAGKRSWFDVLNALRELTQNKIAVVHTKAALVGSTYKLKVKSGEFKQYNG